MYLRFLSFFHMIGFCKSFSKGLSCSEHNYLFYIIQLYPPSVNRHTEINFDGDSYMGKNL